MTMLRRVLLTVLVLYALLFVGLSIDIIARVWEWRTRFETPLDVAALLYFEGMRTVITVAGIAVALLAAARVRFRGGLVELPFVVILATIAYTKIIAFRSFPGAWQARLATWLQEAHAPPVLLDLVFAQPAWTAWLALAGLALMIARFPRPLSPAELSASGVADRRGAMRDVALAGADIGMLSRNAAAAFAASRWSRGTGLYLIAALVGLAHVLTARALPGAAGTAVHALATVAAAAAIAICVALFRAGSAAADGADRRLMEWLRRAGLAGAALFVVSGVSAIALRGSVIAVASLSLVPAALLVGVAVSLRYTRPYAADAEPVG